MTDIRLPVHEGPAVDAGPCYGLGESQSDGANVTEFRKADWPLLMRRKVIYGGGSTCLIDRKGRWGQ